MITPETFGKGYTTEAIKVVLEYGFEQLDLHSMEAIIDPDNIASERVLQKNGFVKEAHILEISSKRNKIMLSFFAPNSLQLVIF